MRRAGCRLICYGIETGSQRLMDILKKKIDLDKVPGAVKMTRKAGIKTRGTFVLGIPTETREEASRPSNSPKDRDRLCQI